jgi:hypothetical protein
MVGVQAYIPSRHLPNAHQKHYHFSQLAEQENIKV